MPVLKRQINFSPNFASFFIVMTHNSPVNFKLIRFLLWRKESHQSSHFKTFECSGENYQIPPVIFPNRRSVFLKFCITLQCHVRQLPCTFLGKRYILCAKGTSQSAHFGDSREFGSTFTKLLPFLKQNSSVLF